MSEMPLDRSQDDVAAVLRSIGRRPSVPAGLTDRVEAQVRSHWQSEVRARRRWRSIGVAAVAAVLGAIAILLPRAPSKTRAIATIAATAELVSHAAWWRSTASSATLAVHRGDRITTGAEVITEDQGRVALVLAGGHSLRIDADTRVTLVSERIIALERGAVYVDSRTTPGVATGTIEIRTAFGTVRDIGTQFEVRAIDAGLTVSVREGKVSVDASGTHLDIGAGHQVRLSSTGEMTQRETNSLSDFAWVNRVTPIMAIDGRPLQSFLEWAARERGLGLEFSSSGAAASASSIVLSGSLEGMTIEEALEAALATSQMAFVMEGAVLRIRSANEPRGVR